MAMEIKHLQTSEADEISRLRAENAELKANVAQLEDNVAFWKKKLDDEMSSRRDEYEEAEKENRKLKRALWIARANRALEKIAWFKLWNVSISTMNPKDGARQEFDKWKNNLGKFLKKAEEYK